MNPRTLIVAIGEATGADRVAVEWLRAKASGEADRGSVGLLVDLGRDQPRPASLIAREEAKALERKLEGAVTGFEFRARGDLVHAGGEPERPAAEVEALGAHLEGVPMAVVATPASYRDLLELGSWDEVIIRTAGEPSALVEILAEEAGDFAGEVSFSRAARRRGHLLSRLRSEGGQATPLVLGGVFVLVLGAVAMVAISGAVTGKADAQRAADLSALSAVRSMKDDLPRLLAPPRLPNGLPNPAHMPKPVFLARARTAAIRTAVVNRASPLAVSVRFPDAASYAPVRARVSIATSVRAGTAGGAHRAPPNWAEAMISMPVSMGSVPSFASGGGYSGPLAERQGKGMRPDVAAAFDAMAAAASADGITLTITSAFRSDAEQAALFAANPDPTWVAPPGQSLHRCATELDLGPSGAYGWLAANAGRFGFTQRYSWEAWHYGFVAGPAPCSDAGNLVGTGGGDRSAALSQAVPSFTPAWVRPLVLRAAMKWNVSAALLAAQLFAESGFDPNAGNGIAFGIAAFTPAAAAEYGLDDPFDPAAAIMAQAHLMSDLLERFGSPALALAAYNAGPGAVGSCGCIPDYPETQAYVAKILAMLGGMGAISPLGMQIELVR